MDPSHEDGIIVAIEINRGSLPTVSGNFLLAGIGRGGVDGQLIILPVEVGNENHIFPDLIDARIEAGLFETNDHFAIPVRGVVRLRPEGIAIGVPGDCSLHPDNVSIHCFVLQFERRGRFANLV